MPENLDSEQRARLWEHRLFIESQIYGRANLFLIIETVLLAVVGTLYSKTGPSILVLKVIGFLGFCLTIIWAYVQDRVKHVFYVINKRCLDNLPEYKVSIDEFGKGRWPFRISAPVVPLLTYVVPGLLALVWIFLLFFL